MAHIANIGKCESGFDPLENWKAPHGFAVAAFLCGKQWTMPKRVNKPDENSPIAVRNARGNTLIQKESDFWITDQQWQTFLDHLAMTCNIQGASREARIHYRSAYDRYKRDPAFARQWDEARQIGMATVKMMLVAKAMGTHGYEPGEDFAPDPATMDAELAYRLVAQYEKANAKSGRGSARLPVAASEEEACTEILKRLKVLGIRLKKDRSGQEKS